MMQNPVIKRLMMLAGCLCVVLGVIGLIMPMMPGALFLFLAAWLFSRSSERFHQWLLDHNHLGPVVKAFESGEGMTRQLRRRILLIMWGSMLISMVIVAKLWVIVVITCCGAAATYYLFKQPVY